MHTITFSLSLGVQKIIHLIEILVYQQCLSGKFSCQSIVVYFAQQFEEPATHVRQLKLKNVNDNILYKHQYYTVVATSKVPNHQPTSAFRTSLLE